MGAFGRRETECEGRLVEAAGDPLHHGPTASRAGFGLGRRDVCGGVEGRQRGALGVDCDVDVKRPPALRRGGFSGA
jgi:hypothetical protein